MFILRAYEDSEKLACVLKDYKGWLAFDTETIVWQPGQPLVGPTGPIPVCMSLAWEGGSAYVPWAYAEPLRHLFKGDIPKVGHNIGFDAHALANVGWELGGVWYDTMVMAFAADTNRFSYGLKELAKDWLKVSPKTFEEALGTPRLTKKGEPYKNGKVDIPPLDTLVDDPRMIEYAVADAVNTYELAKLARKKLEDQGTWQTYCRVTRDVTKILWKMERRGIAFDSTLIAEKTQQARNEAADLLARFQSWAGPTVNIRSTKQMAELLFKHKGFKPTGYTRTGTPKLDLEAIQDLAASVPDPNARQALEALALSKVISKQIDAFLIPLPGCVVNGRIHCSFWQNRAVSGRFSCTNPNLQQVSARKDRYGIRRMFRATPGYKLLVADLSGIEWVLATEVCGDETLLKNHKNGIDPHSFTAYSIFPEITAWVDARGGPSKDNLHAVKKTFADQRSIAKIVNFAMIYGAGPYKLARSMGCTVDEARTRLDNWHRAYPGFKQWVRETEQDIRNKHYVTTLAGRRRHADMAAIYGGTIQECKAELRSLLNTCIQGSASDLMCSAMLALDKSPAWQATGAHLLLSVHDELVAEVPENNAERALILLREYLRLPYASQLNVTVTAEAGIGDTWKDAK